MFLAIKEIKKEKMRFLMVIAVTALVAYLVYFLSGLAYGLARSNTTSLDFLKQKHIVLSDASNMNIYASNIKDEKLIENYNNFTLTSSVVRLNETSDNFDLIMMGLSDIENLDAYTLLEGQDPSNDGEVVVSESLLKNLELSIGDELVIADNDNTLVVVGITKEADYNTKPVAFMTQTTLGNTLYGGSQRVSALVTDNSTFTKENLVALNYDEFISYIPGYQAQVLTFGMMILSLVLIAAIVIAIFMFIITMQKKSIFGVLKVQGFTNGYIGKSVIYQTLLVTVVGVVIGFVLTLITFYFLPNTVPVKINSLLYGVVSALTLGCSLIGALFSAKTILKIDPLDAI